MNKKLIAIAIAATMAAPAAMADVKITGQLGAAFVSSSKDQVATPTASTAGKSDDSTKAYRGMQDSGLSKLDFKGTAGNAYTHIGMDIRNLMAGSTLAGRDLYLGYKFGKSTLQFGRMGSALAGIEGDKYNATFLELRRTAGVSSTKNNMTDSFATSPIVQFATKVGSAAIKVQFDPADNSQGSTTEGYAAISVKGKAGAVGYFAGYNNGTGTGESGATNKDSNTKVGLSMKFGAAKATLMNMASDNDGVKATANALLVDMGLGNGLDLGLGYGQNKDKDTWSRVAITKKINKGTKIFGGVTSKKGDAASIDATKTSGTSVGVGMAIKF